MIAIKDIQVHIDNNQIHKLNIPMVILWTYPIKISREQDYHLALDSKHEFQPIIKILSKVQSTAQRQALTT